MSRKATLARDGIATGGFSEQAALPRARHGNTAGYLILTTRWYDRKLPAGPLDLTLFGHIRIFGHDATVDVVIVAQNPECAENLGNRRSLSRPGRPALCWVDGRRPLQAQLLDAQFPPSRPREC